MMHLDLPPDARVHVVIFPPGAPAVPDVLALPQAVAPQLRPPPAPRRRLLKGVVVACLMGGAWFVGHRTAPSDAMPAALAHLRLAPQSSDTAPAPSSDGVAAAAPSDTPDAFLRQLQKPPTVTPPPGAPAPASSGAPEGKSPFGLEN